MSNKTTVLSVGCVLFEIMTLRAPYEYVEEPQQYILHGIRPPLELNTKSAFISITVPEEIQHTTEWKVLGKLFEWCTERVPSERPSATQVLQELKQMEEKERNKQESGS